MASPNYNERPDVNDIRLLVIHNISLPAGQFGGDYISDFFCNKLDADEHPYFQEIAHLQVSSHFLIKRCGAVVQFVACDKRAWHAGVSEYLTERNCNDFSIGIELEGCDDVSYAETQYQSLDSLVKSLLVAYPRISTQHIVGHSDIAPGRKTDPGPAFDWSYFRELLSR